VKGFRGHLAVTVTGGLEEVVTPWAGASTLVEAYRRYGVGDAADRALPKKKTAKGLSQGQMTESFVLLSALGGECVEDMEKLRQDKGLEMMLGYKMPAAETARQWLDKFHDEESMSGQPEQGAFIPVESAPLAGLREPIRQVIWRYIEKMKPGQEVTLDVDAHLVETSKANAFYCYDGRKAFQPIEVEWAETGLVLAEEFRQGNVLPGKDIKRVVNEAFEVLPPGEWEVKVRSDSAAYQQDLLDHWHRRKWHFAVSADMSIKLRQAIEALPAEAWGMWYKEKGGMIREWAEVPFTPSRKNEKRDTEPYRYLAVRIRCQQGELFEGGAAVRHFCVVTNLWDMEGQKLLDWQRGKAGTIEQVHHILISELAAGVYPSYKHGANAAWLRLQVLTYNLLQLLKAVALPPQYGKAQPKRLRFAIFTQFGRVIQHAGQTLLRLANSVWQHLIDCAFRRIMAPELTQ
jgi:hypothetical protein